MLDYIKVDDFQGTESLQGNETRARVVEALKITSHTLQANRSKEGTIVTVKDLINLPREVSCQVTSVGPSTLSGTVGHPNPLQPSFKKGAGETGMKDSIHQQVRENAVFACMKR